MSGDMSTRLVALAASVAALTACAVTEGGWDSDGVFTPAPTDGVQGDAPQDGGAALFKEKCGACHDDSGLGMGTGLLSRRYEGDLALLENRENLTPPFIELVVRNGVGNMPRMSRAEVSDAQLAAIAAYLSNEEPAP